MTRCGEPMREIPAYTCQLVTGHEGRHVVRLGMENFGFGGGTGISWPVRWADGCPHDARHPTRVPEPPAPGLAARRPAEAHAPAF